MLVAKPRGGGHSEIILEIVSDKSQILISYISEK